MRKALIFTSVLVAILMIATSAYALSCKVGQSKETSDECWTAVYIEPGYPNLVSKGALLVVSAHGLAVADANGMTARHATASADIALGAAQAAIQSGDSGVVLARGRGVLNTSIAGGSVTSGDALAIAGDPYYAESAAGSNRISGDVVKAASTHYGKQRVATSLETQSANDTLNIVYMQVV